jgi:hypothetical protein
MPIEGEDLVIEEKHPLAKFSSDRAGETAPVGKEKFINQWWSHRKRGTILVFDDQDGKRTWGFEAGAHHFVMDMRTMGCSVAWSVESEANALQLLATLVPHRTFKMYLMTGMFLETSKRSGITYCFRKLRPTVALNARTGKTPRILCCLCAHGIGYYSNSWAGSMTPTDDVISHLLMMRSDEKFFWRRCNQHPPHRPESGL